MVQTAPLMDLLSSAVCGGSYVEDGDCSWYHGVWQYLRILDMVSTPTWHPRFYVPELTALARERDGARLPDIRDCGLQCTCSRSMGL